jgi:MoxR-vWA-beta-propeller ternary system domain bpX2
MQPVADTIRGWALRLPRAVAAEACALRLEVGIEVGETPDSVWLRGRGENEDLARRLKTLSASAWYVWLENGRMRPRGSLLATESMPELAWAPLRAWARIEPPPARLAAGLPLRVLPQLVASQATTASNALLLDFTTWSEWALRAPGARLERLAFATAADGKTLVLGAPVPAAPGRHCVATDGVVIPAGLAWEQAVSTEVIRRVCGAGEGEYVFWDEAGARILGRELFVPATRAAVRATRLALEAEAGA